jgi:DNA-binding MarR family transcriptional regulator
MPQPLGQLLRTPHQAFEQELERRLRQGRFRDIRTAHLAVFDVLPATGARLTELAAKANMTKQSMQYLVDHLAAAGYLRRTPDPTDSRAQILHGTDRARRLCETLAKLVDDIEIDWAARVGKSDFASLKRLLGQLNHGLKGA